MWGLKRFEKSVEPVVHQYERRTKESNDRRVFGPPSKFPLVDSVGKIVKLDRRATPDRRIANIEVKEDYLIFDQNRFSSNC